MATQHFVRARDLGFPVFNHEVRQSIRPHEPMLINGLIDYASKNNIPRGDVINVLMNNGRFATTSNNYFTYVYDGVTFFPFNELSDVFLFSDDEPLPFDYWKDVELDSSQLQKRHIFKLPRQIQQQLFLEKCEDSMDADRNILHCPLNIRGKTYNLVYPTVFGYRDWYINERLQAGNCTFYFKQNDDREDTIYVCP